MGSIYQAKDKHVLYMTFKNAAGVWKSKSTGIRVVGLSAPERKKQERRAKAMLDKIEARIAAGNRFESEAGGPPTVRRYAEQWIEERTRRRLGSADDDDARLRHAMPHVGDMLLGDVRVRHVRDMMRSLKKKIGRERSDMSPRNVLHVYRTLHTMFEEAVADELIDANPCKLKKSELPKKVDKDPEWRSGAIFTRDEIETIIADDDMPRDRRVLNTLLSLTGMRFGEVAALRWSAFDSTAKPLGTLSVHASYDVKKKRRKGVKTDVPRRVPVHPVLSRVLTEWRLIGWEVAMGRPPGRDDLIVPTPDGKHRGKPRDSRPSLKKFHGDLDRLELRRRRQHDLRRTFVTLCLADGARKDVLRWVTHGPEGDIVDLYTTLPWEALCDEVAKLKIEWRVGKVIPFSPAASADTKSANSDEQGSGVYYPFTTPDQNSAASQKKIAEVHGNRT